MAEANRIAVIDIGKTNAKVVLFDMESQAEIAQRSRRNAPLSGEYSHFDVDGLWTFICRSLSELHAEKGIEAISITTHGACFALLDAAGELALPVMDYEDSQPDALDADYRQIRPLFEETGTPRLPMGLNAAAMLYWQMRTFPEAFAKVVHIVPWPQYWAFRLTGVLATETTSLGVHTDLWNPHEGRFSTLVTALGWERLMPPIRSASDILGPVRPNLAGELGLPRDLPVHCGIHDSNASLLPHLLVRQPPFTVLSTGTWVVTLSVGGRDIAYDEARDVLINVNARGLKTPSARFMGGRAFELLGADFASEVTKTDRLQVLTLPIMALPSWPPGSGPFPRLEGHWSAEPETPGQRRFAASLHLALMSAETLELVGAEGDIIVEGPFAANIDFLSMLGSLTGRRPVVSTGRLTGTSFGAACLALGGRAIALDGKPAERVVPDPMHLAYARFWREAVHRAQSKEGQLQ
jgi:sugar (pentulose or hexulose) kinase